MTDTTTAARTDDGEALAIVIDAYERTRTAALRTVRPLAPMLTDALHALDAGRLDVVREFIERTRDDLDRAAQVLRDGRPAVGDVNPH